MKQILNLGLILCVLGLFIQPMYAQNAYNIADFASSRALGAGYEGDGGPALDAKFISTNKMALDAQGNIYVADRLRVRRIDATTNTITTVVGDGSPYTPTSFEVLDIALDKLGNLYMINFATRQVLYMHNTTGVIVPVAGNGVSGFSGDGGPAIQAQLSSPKAIALDAANNLYIADGVRIRKVDATTGMITTIAGGSGGTTTDGVPALNASLAPVNDLALDAMGNIYLVEVSRNRVRKIDAETNLITTVAGNIRSVSNNPIGLATQVNLRAPHGVDVDAEGNIYIVDYYYVRKVDAVTGIISPIAGQWGSLSEPIAGNATKADFSLGHAVLVKSSKEVYAAQRHWIRKLTSYYTEGLIVADQVEATAGNTVKVPIKAQDLSAFAGIQFEMNFPSDKASFVGLTNINSKLTGFGTNNYNEVSSGKVRMIWADAAMQNKTFQNDEVLFEIELNIPANATAGEQFLITFDNSIVIDREVKTLKVGHKMGSVTIVSLSSIAGAFKTPTGQPIKGASMSLNRTDGTFDTHNVADDGTYIVSGLTPGTNYQLVPDKPSAKVDNGVDVGDIIAVRRHILQKELLDSPYKLIAADIDLSKSINVADVLIMRRAILGMYNNALQITWWFIPESFTFVDPTNPWSPSFADSYVFTATNTQATQDFIGVKLGDVNYNATPTLRTNTQAVELNTPTLEAMNGDVVRIPVTVGANYSQIAGLQGSLEFDPKVLQYQGVEAGVLSIESQHLNTANAAQGLLSFVYDQSQGEAESFDDGQVLYYLTFKAIGNAGQAAAIKLSSAQTKATAYSQASKSTTRVSLNAGEVKLIAPVVNIFPNPAKNFNVQFEVTTNESKVTFTLKDQQGKTVSLREATFAQGQHTVSFEPNVIAGNYFLTIEYNQHKIVKKVMIK